MRKINRKNKRRDNHNRFTQEARDLGAESWFRELRSERNALKLARYGSDRAAIQESLQSVPSPELRLHTNPTLFKVDIQRETTPAYRAMLKAANTLVRMLRAERAERVRYYRAG